jgi:DNA repair protein RadC
MNDEVWKDFFDDDQTRRVMNSSEVWRNYVQSELAREELQKANAVKRALDNENQLMADVEAFRQKVASNPALKAYLKKAQDVLKQHPELKEKVDPNFLTGLELLDLED